ncbi:hypothetical protein EW146_g2998 [Bondarzewia mesenterica]|uniref:HMG box domain-containing protein n=1 Tax=Bondarzewia mesenterica TaxID=1095465 RepID=A0A4S4M0G7_9AGAM|nr:hypothetical protein EW146_g2998 [Bondarzewia mesenterica]
MAKAVTESTTKAATRRTNNKTVRSTEAGAKPKRAPSAYNLFVQANMKPWLEANQGKSVKEAMVHIGSMWRDAPENPNRGKEQKPRKPRATKASKKKAEDAEGPQVEPSSDD